MEIKQVKPNPFVKWVGGKSKLYPTLAEYFPEHFNRYFEPFVGGGAVMFNLRVDKPYCQIVASDNNYNLIECYEVVKNFPGELINRLNIMKNKFNSLNPAEQEGFYYTLRAEMRDNSCKFPLARAARFIVINKLCYNGLYRVNSDGEFNVPYGKYKNPGLFTVENIVVCSEALQSVELLHTNYGHIANKYSAQLGDFFYLDPPYFDTFTGYSKAGFNWNEQKTLCKHLDRLTQAGAKAMVSNSWCQEIWDLYEGYNRYRINSSSSVSCKAESRGKKYEILVTNYDIAGKYPELSFSEV